ncbi:MAG: DUF4011 domain-containing protein, partial [Bacteroidetes bacterium]|nr:DUF4011 domain-containing protein [Bacteroidota bacterium]
MQEHFLHILHLNKAIDDWDNDQVYLHFHKLLKELAALHQEGFWISNLFEALETTANGLQLKSSYKREEIVALEENYRKLDKQHQAEFRLPEEIQNTFDTSRNIYELALLLLAYSCKLNLYQGDDYKLFLEFQDNLLALNPALHPGIANLIQEMLQLDSELRLKDLDEAIYRLKNYQLYQNTRTSTAIAPKELLPSLKQKLFDLSRRNRMLYFKESKKLLNLSYLSWVKDVNTKNKTAAKFLNWNRHLQKLISKEQNLKLEAFFQDSENFPIHNALNKLRLEANKDIKEFGFSQLKLALVFLHWTKFENGVQEAISSPLLLLPVSIIRKKGIESSFELHFEDSSAEINPVLRHQFKELFALELPESIDLENEDIDDFYALFLEEIQAKSLSLKLNLQYGNKRFEQYTKALNYAKKLFHKEALQSAFIFEYETEENYFQSFSSPINYTPSSKASQTNTWVLDSNPLVLGNFNSKRMSLLKDFEEIEEKNMVSPLFNTFFSHERPNKTPETSPIGFQELYNVLASDPSQDESIFQANSGKSYLIQGPPGTGKSQTISNLIANLLAQDKKVLFVCEKRAAIDVVYERLQEIGLSSHCSLIHDSQVDKKSFIADLKNNYEALQRKDIDLNLVEKERERILLQIQNSLDGLKLYHELMLHYASEEQQNQIRHLYDEMIALRYALPPNYMEEKNSIPPYDLWEKNKE